MKNKSHNYIVAQIPSKKYLQKYPARNTHRKIKTRVTKVDSIYTNPLRISEHKLHISSDRSHPFLDCCFYYTNWDGAKESLYSLYLEFEKSTLNILRSSGTLTEFFKVTIEESTWW